MFTMENNSEEIESFVPKNQKVNTTVAPLKNEESSNKLKRELGLFDAVSVIVGIIVGIIFL